MVRKHKHPGGRPLLGAERRRDYKVTLEPRVAELLREYGGGNLSAGIARAAESVKTPEGLV